MSLSAMQFVRGGQIFLYNMRMMIQVTNRIMGWAILGFLVLITALMFYNAYDEIVVICLHWLSQFLVYVGKGNNLVWHSDANQGISASAYLSSPVIIQGVIAAKNNVWQTFINVLMFSSIFYWLIIVFFYIYFMKKGEGYSKDKFISGTRLAKNTKETLQSLKKSSRGLSEIKLLNKLPMPKRSEKQGIFFHGSIGAGKSQAIMQLLEQLRQTGDPVIVYDKECTIKPYFFNKDIDVELNPVSELCANWDLWAECDNPMELGSVATYLIPKSVQGSDPFWVDAARTILTSMAWKIKAREDKSIIVLLQLLLTTTLDEMRGLLKGTESENLVSKEIEKTAISIKSVLATYTKALRFLEGLNNKDKEKFSIKKWIENTCQPDYNKGWLFITSRSKYHKEIKPLISLWLGLVMQGVQSLSQDSNRRIWIVMDELASLHRLEMLSDTMADIRKFGGCVAIGIQSISQLQFLYGNHEAEAIADLLNTSVYFRSPKSKVAKWVSDDLSEQVISEVKESRSYGPDSVRDGNTIGTNRSIRKTVEAGDIMTLEDLECFVRLIGNHPITKIKNKYIERDEICEPLKERSIDFDALEKINQLALSAQNNPEVCDEVRKIKDFEEKADEVLKIIDSPKEKEVIDNDSMEIESKESPLVFKEIG
ncbi:MAG TPA: type IV conjugative transfer system coupling protein TraD [Gammaproteobacteria bacterium]|nr:type IV conjugative transfer system coupling protein TraD [Gammaproteobacteria bacterium]|tara:strand:- start:305 stop:2260 length:1956 start_codon:yes stop_codon:yes gene_type:complete